MKYHHSAFIYLALKKGTLIAKEYKQEKYNIERIKQKIKKPKTMEQFKTFFHRQSVATKRNIIPCKKRNSELLHLRRTSEEE